MSRIPREIFGLVSRTLDGGTNRRETDLLSLGLQKTSTVTAVIRSATNFLKLAARAVIKGISNDPPNFNHVKVSLPSNEMKPSRRIA